MSDAQGAEAQITIRRDLPEDVQQRQIVVKVDGERIGELMYGEKMTIPVKAGHHRLVVDNTWKWKTVELDVAAGEHVKYVTVSKAGKLMWFLVSMFGAGPMDVAIQREE